MIKIDVYEFKESTYKNKGLLKFKNIVIGKLSKFFQNQPYTGKFHKINLILTIHNIFCLIFDSIVIWKIYDTNPSNMAVNHI